MYKTRRSKELINYKPADQTHIKYNLGVKIAPTRARTKIL